ncbi:MAG: phosphoadenylyl-sulfate reductase [Ideonella sp.]|nr:phosphoadenylyl-sulfate reductase [Ideonella sp.]MCC7458683.1 phosphoadenylyl-sulfate reductase [Nitrospira sp.]
MTDAVSSIAPRAPAADVPGGAIALYARETPGFAARVEHALALLRDAAHAHAGHIVQASSLGAEDMVITDLIARHRLPIALATLETGRLHAQTLDLAQRTEAHYGRPIEHYRPPHDAVVHFVDRHGEDAMFRSIELRKACCALRKLEPLQRLLAGRSAWVTGLRREQSDTRGAVPFSEADEHGRAKLSPLADWSWHDVWHYIALHRAPYNPLHDAFMPSIGCAPCTRAIAVGEDFRAGRWWWEGEGLKECGLHVGAAHASPALSAQHETPPQQSAQGAFT